jgi:Kef-type K+ transport system membrane component KefB
VSTRLVLTVCVLLARSTIALAADGGSEAALDAGITLDALDAEALVDAGELLDAGVVAPTPPAAEVVDAGVTPSDATSAIVGEPPPEPMTPPTAETTTESTVFAIKVIGGLIALLVLAYLGAHRRVVRFQEQLGISGVITAGFPFVALGLVASLEPVGILNGQVIENLRSIMFFGLGWLGFIIGAQLDIRVLERVPKGTAYLIIVEAIGPFVAVGAACGGLMLAFGSSWDDPAVWRDAILLGTAAAMTAPRKFRGFANRTWRENRGADVLLAQLDELVGVIGLLFITAYFRPDTSAWNMPSTAWVFMSLGIGVVIGALIFVIIRMPTSNAEFFAVLVGGIAFASGFAGYLDLSPIVVCFIAGALVTNFPNDQRAQIFRILRHFERPVHLLFLIIAGALWTVADWRGWVLVPVFVAARVLGKWFGVVASKSVIGSRMPERFLEQRVLIAPLSALSTALVISFAGSHASQSITWVVTAVIGGAIVTELLIPAAPPEPPAPERIDELDEGDDERGEA